jgi:hypothetical protein
MLTLGMGVRAFGFEHDLTDGYFDPDFYGIGELTTRWSYSPGPWSFLLEVAPGAQRVGAEGPWTGAIRSSARIAYGFDRGREISVAVGYSSAGLHSFSTGASDYRYKALVFGAGWAF